MTVSGAALSAIERLVAAAARREPVFARLLAEFLAGRGAPVTTGTAAVWGEDCLFVVDSERPAQIAVDDREAVEMDPVEGTAYRIHLARIRPGRTYNYTVVVDGTPLGPLGVGPHSVAGYGALSYPIPQAPVGQLSARRRITSAIYGGAVADCWVYANPGIDTEAGAPVMVWLDGQGCIGREDALGMRVQTVTDNLVYRGDIPPMVHVLIAPSVSGSRQPAGTPDIPAAAAMRSLQYDQVTDEFGRYLLEEVLPEVGAGVKLRQDGYSRAIAGASSGGVCAFKVGWFAPEQFSRVHSTIGSFTALGWQPRLGIDGGQMFPFLVRREPRKNLRVWLSDGAYDLDVDADITVMGVYRGGSWPLGNLQMAQALKTKGYDFHFRYGEAGHNYAQAGLDLPEALTWLWRDYDPSRTSQTYEQEPEEAAKPAYRFGIVNRDAW